METETLRAHFTRRGYADTVPAYVGCERTARAIVIGAAFGPSLLAVRSSLQDAFDEYDERYGERVDGDDLAIADYTPTERQLADAGGDMRTARIFCAMDHGDVRSPGSGSIVWVDPNEWCREFASVAEALAWLRQA